jgi:replicative DNA helicase
MEEKKNGQTLFSKFLNKVKDYKNNREQGKFNCIPLPFERLTQIIPGFQQGTNIIITANSGVGKSLLTKYMTVFWPYIWCKENPESGISFKSIYFALEESKEEFIASATSFFLHYYKNIKVSPDDILSMHKDTILDNNTLQAIEELGPIMEDFLSKVDIQDTIGNVTGAYKYVRQYATDNGTHHYKTIKIDGQDVEVYSHYEPNDPDEYMFIQSDHDSLWNPESGESLHNTMSKWSATYGRKQITKHFNYISVNVQQQNAASEQQQYDNKGNPIFNKLRPSLSELADNKLTARNAFLVFGLFAPDRYEIPTYNGYNIYKMKDNYRSLSVLKNRRGRSSIETSLYFDGATCNFKELPRVSKSELSATIDGMPEDKWYELFKKDKDFFWKNKQQTLFTT